jgi:hypothetical protein
MKLGRDLQSKSVLYLKASLFLILLLLGIGLNLIETALAWRAASLMLIIWSAARLYYFMFYVIERYIDSEYRFSSVYSCLCYLLRRKR